MTPDKIEAKALEEFPVRLPATAFGYPVSDQDQNAKERAAFIKGCQYAATAQPLTRSEAEKWIQSEYPIQVDEVHFKNGNYINMDIHAPIREGMYRLYDHLASLSPAQPGYSQEQVREAIRRARICDRTGSYPTPDEIISLLNKQP